MACRLAYRVLVRLTPFLNRRNSVTLEQLERVLHGSGYRTYVKPRLKDVIAPSPREQLTLSEERMVNHGHLDFVVLNPRPTCGSSRSSSTGRRTAIRGNSAEIV